MYWGWVVGGGGGFGGWWLGLIAGGVGGCKLSGWVWWLGVFLGVFLVVFAGV